MVRGRIGFRLPLRYSLTSLLTYFLTILNDENDSGESSKNDPSKIKKAMKRKMNAKKKSAVAWKGRIEKTNQSKIERQTIRQHNLKQRKVGGAAGANLSKKRISEDAEAGETKRRRMGPHSEKSRAGFEGKKQGFINEKDNKRSVVAK